MLSYNSRKVQTAIADCQQTVTVGKREVKLVEREKIPLISLLSCPLYNTSNYQAYGNYYQVTAKKSIHKLESATVSSMYMTGWSLNVSLSTGGQYTCSTETASSGQCTQSGSYEMQYVA